MELKVDIEFTELLKVVKTLSPDKKNQLKAVIDEPEVNPSINLKNLLLNGPVATKKQLETIAKNRKAINKWRTK